MDYEINGERRSKRKGNGILATLKNPYGVRLVFLSSIFFELISDNKSL